MWQALISPLANLVGGYLNNKHEQAQAKHQARLKVIEHDADWETKMAVASGSSGRTSGGLSASRFLWLLSAGASLLMIPALWTAFMMALLLYPACLIFTRISFFLRSVLPLESGAQTN